MIDLRRPLLTAASTLLVLSGPVAHAAGRDAVRVVGSSTVYPFSTTVAEHVGRELHGRTPVVESTGTGGGFKLFCAGGGIDTPDINDASRPITDGEKSTCASSGAGPVDEIRVGYDGIILGSSAKSPGFDVTREQLWRATAARVPVGGKWVANPYRNWSDIDPKLPKRPISIYGPATNHGTRDAFVELVMEPSCEHAPEYASLPADQQKKACSQVREDGRWTDVSEDYSLVMGKLAADPQATAVFTFSYLDQNRDKIRAAKVDGVAASLETISSGRYPMSRPLFIYVKQSHLGQVPGLAEFVREFVSPAAAGPDGYLADKGLIPMPPAERQAQAAAVAKLLPASR
jgi:phosphate transport system substrate-binding protein